MGLSRSWCAAFALLAAACADDTDDLDVATACNDWCTLALDCEEKSAEAELSDVFGSIAACEHPALDDTHKKCVDACLGNTDPDFPPGVPGECLGCQSLNYRKSCVRDESWVECVPCGEWDLEDVLRPLQPDLSCRPVGVDPSAPVCDQASRTFFTLYSLLDGASMQRFEIAMTATVVSVDPLTFLLEDGHELQVMIDRVGKPNVVAGQHLSIEAKSQCPFSCQDQLVLRDEDDALIYAIWSGPKSYTPVLSDVALEYVPAECVSAHVDCYSVLHGDLQVTLPPGLTIAVAPGTTAMLGDLEIVHASASQTFQINCTDVGGGEVASMIRRL